MHYFGICVCMGNDAPGALMARYDENASEFMVEEIGEETCADSYLTDTARFHVSPDGRLFFAWNSPYAPQHRLTANGYESINEELPEDWEEKELPVSEYYPNLWEYLEDWKGYEFDSVRRVHFRLYNPDGKYDYMRIGGRRVGKLKATTGEMADPDWEVTDYLNRHPDKTLNDLYGEDGYDIAKVDDVIKDEQFIPYFVVTPDGEWHDESEWRTCDARYDKNYSDDEIAEMREKLWNIAFAPYVGKDCTAYVIDIHY